LPSVVLPVVYVYLFCMPHDAAFGTVSCLAWGPVGCPACMGRWESRETSTF